MTNEQALDAALSDVADRLKVLVGQAAYICETTAISAEVRQTHMLWIAAVSVVLQFVPEDQQGANWFAQDRGGSS